MSDSNANFEFGPFRLDAERLLLLRGEEAIPLSPKVFETLLYLVVHHGQVTKKGDILNSIWPDTFVEESNLSQNIFLLRKALGEEKNEHRYIVTIPGVGYRFVAPVRELSATPARRQDDSIKPVNSIAVLPFKNLAGETDDKFLGPGLADALIMRLSSIRDLKVRPTAAVLKFNGVRDDPVVIGRELGVDALLDGVYQNDTDKIRVSVQLVSVTSGTTLWAAKFDENLTDIFAIQDSISEQVVRSLALKLNSDEQRQLKQSYTLKPEAFQLFVRGRYFWNQRTDEGLRKALDYAQRAIDMDPTYAPAYIALADTYSLLGAQHSVLAPRESFPKARAAVIQALEIDEKLAEAYASLGFINYCFEWDFQSAELSYLKAIELKPNYATAHHWYGEMLVTLGRFEEAYVELSMAQELDPLSLAINVDLAAYFYFSRQYAQSQRHLINLLELNANFIRAYMLLGKIHDQLGESAKAVEMLYRAVELSGDDPVTNAALARALANSDNLADAYDVLEELTELRDRRYVSAGLIAGIQISLGLIDEAFASLAEAHENRDIELVWLKVDPVFDPVRSDPRFIELVKKVNPVLL